MRQREFGSYARMKILDGTSNQVALKAAGEQRRQLVESTSCPKTTSKRSTVLLRCFLIRQRRNESGPSDLDRNHAGVSRQCIGS